MRELLLSEGPILLEVQRAHLFLASYLDESLPLSTTRATRLTDLGWTVDRLRRPYDRVRNRQ